MMNNSELLDRLSKIKRNSFKQIPNKDINEIVKSLSPEDVRSLVPGIHDDIDLIIFKWCFSSNKDLPDQLAAIKPYLKFMNSWYDVDMCMAYISSPIDFDFYLPICQKYISDKNPFVRRLGYVILIKADLSNEDILNRIFSLIKEDGDHNVRMAEGWLISFMFIKSFDFTYNFLLNDTIPYSISRIGLSKGLDSYQISSIDKLKIKKLRRVLFDKHTKNVQ